MAAKHASQIKLTERDLSRWRLIEDFKARLDRAAQTVPLPSTWSDPARLLKHTDYLSLFLLGLLNPVVRTLRGLCAASHLDRVQKEVCSRPVSLGSFSEAQAVLDPALLADVFAQLSRQLPTDRTQAGPAGRRWLIQDGSLFEALPRMYWALWRRQGKAQSQVRLHLSLDLRQNAPARALITPGKGCERAAWRTQWQRGEGYVADRYYGEDYQLFGELDEAGVAFVVRLRDEAVINVEEELPLTDADRQAKVIRAAWVWLGCKARYRSIRLRVVWVQTDKEVLRLVTNLSPEELSAGAVALLYKQRWQIELFFRWVKCILGCRHWLAESPQGVAIQIYLALIAALLLQLYTGQAPNRRMMELIQFYLLGVASLEELWAGVQRERAVVARRKKS
ncbi:MAG: IS4 family transposase [Acidobacteriota bacterium]